MHLDYKEIMLMSLEDISAVASSRLRSKLMSLGRRLAVMAALFANYPGRMAVEAAELWVYYNTYWPDP